MSKNRLENEIEKSKVEKTAIEAQTEMNRDKYAAFVNDNLHYIINTTNVMSKRYKLPSSIRRKKNCTKFLIKLKKFLGLS